MNIHRKIYVLHRTTAAPINLVYGSDAVEIELELMDYTLSSTATADAYASVLGSGEVYTTSCTVSGNTVTFTPETNLFQPGENDLQIKIATGGTLISFAIPVMCDNNLSIQGVTDLESVPTLVQVAAQITAVRNSKADSTDLDAETERAKTAEKTIKETVSALDTNKAAATDLSAEAERAKSAEKTIRESVSALDTSKAAAADLTAEAKRAEAEEKALDEKIAANEDAISALNSNLESYVAKYSVNGLKYENSMLYLTKDDEIVGDGVEIVSSSGGGGGASNNATLTVTNSTGWLSTTISGASTCILKFNWSSVEDDTPTGNGTATVRINGTQKMLADIAQGEVTLNITSYLQSGTNSVKLTVSDVYGNSRTINFTVNVLSYILTSTFDSSTVFTGIIPYVYIATGSGSKKMHFLIDGAEIATYDVLTSGRQSTQNLPAQSHGDHILEAYFTVEISDTQTIESNHMKYDLICINSSSEETVISSDYFGTSEPQYATIAIPYMVYNPESVYSTVELSVNGSVLSTLYNIDRTKHTWSYRATETGTLTLKISSGGTDKIFSITVTESDMHIEATTEDLELYLTAKDRSNSEASPGVWTYGNIAATMTGFDFVSNGWMLDDDNNAMLHIDGGAKVTIPFKPFATDIRTTGKTIEIEFSTSSVRDYESTIIDCFSGNKGIRVTPQMAYLKSELAELSTYFKENEHVRLSFVIEKRAETKLELLYINGILSAVKRYQKDADEGGEEDDFQQASPVGITIGSDDCAIDIYCIRVYNNDLTRYQIVENFIADTQNVNDMVNRYERNDIFDEYSNIVIDKLPTELPYMIITGTALPTYKGDKKTVSVEFTDPSGTHPNFTAEGVSIDVQGTSSAGYAVKNFKCSFKKGFNVNGNESTTYQMTANSVATNVFTFKADVASSEGCNNVELVNLYNDICPYKTRPQEENSMIRQGIAGFPMVIFFNDGTKTSFVGKYNFNNDKSTPEVFGFASGDESWEGLDNGQNLVLFKSADYTDWSTSWEGRYPDGNADITNIKAFSEWVVSTDQDQATGAALQATVTYDDVEYTADTAAYRLAKFKAEASQHMSVEDACFYWLYTELFLLSDSRGKNLFPTFYKATDGSIRWCFIPYDMDTAIGINNEGLLVYGYSLEDTDHTESGANIYTAQNSVLWKNVREAFPDKIASMYATLRAGGLSYADTENRFEAHQANWSEAIFNEDAYFKYIGPLVDSNDASYLGMCLGSKAEQRKWWLYNRFKYIDSKYVAGDSASDIITVRAYNKSNITVTPYADIYVAVKFGASLVQTRGTRNQSYEMVCPIDDVSDKEIYIYNCSQLKSVGDLSGLKVGYADFSKAVKLTSLKLGDSSADYSNGNLSELYLGENKLLKTIDVRNCTGLTASVNLSGCSGIEEVYFDGTNTTGVFLPNGSTVKTLHLPASITNLTILNQKNITDFVIAGTSNISTLRVENCGDAVDVLSIVNQMADGSRVRLIGFTKTVDSVSEISTLFDQFDKMRGMDENGNNTLQAQVVGKIIIDTITGSEYAALKDRYSSVEIQYSHISSTVTFYDETGSLLGTATSVDGSAVSYSGSMTKASTAQYTYTFDGWSTTLGGAVKADALTNITGDKSLYAVYTANLRSYTITFVNDTSGTAVTLQTSSVPYGTVPSYTGATPTYAGSETDTYGDFDGWSPSLAAVTGSATYRATFKDLSFKFATSSWADISNVLSEYYKGNISDITKYFNVGDIRTMDDGADWCIIGTETENLSDGSGKAAITMMKISNLTSGIMNAASTYEYADYTTSIGRTKIEELISTVDADAQPLIKEVAKQVCHTTDKSNNFVVTDFTAKMFMPSMYELRGSNYWGGMTADGYYYSVGVGLLQKYMDSTILFWERAGAYLSWSGETQYMIFKPNANYQSFDTNFSVPTGEYYYVPICCM